MLVLDLSVPRERPYIISSAGKEGKKRKHVSTFLEEKCKIKGEKYLLLHSN